MRAQALAMVVKKTAPKKAEPEYKGPALELNADEFQKFMYEEPL